MDDLIQVLRAEMRSGFTEMRSGFTQMRSEMSDLRTELSEFRAEVNQRLNGIGVYLRSINGNIEKHAGEIFTLKQRMDRLDPPEA